MDMHLLINAQVLMYWTLASPNIGMDLLKTCLKIRKAFSDAIRILNDGWLGQSEPCNRTCHCDAMIVMTGNACRAQWRWTNDQAVLC